jgi:hypothetical protein
VLGERAAVVIKRYHRPPPAPAVRAPRPATEAEDCDLVGAEVEVETTAVAAADAADASASSLTHWLHDEQRRAEQLRRRLKREHPKSQHLLGPKPLMKPWELAAAAAEPAQVVLPSRLLPPGGQPRRAWAHVEPRKSFASMKKEANSKKADSSEDKMNSKPASFWPYARFDKFAFDGQMRELGKALVAGARG